MKTITGTRDQARDFLTAHGAGEDEAAGVWPQPSSSPAPGRTPRTGGPLSSTRCPPERGRPPTPASPRSA